MTKRERQLHSMLNYFEISTGGQKDETMTKSQKKNFADMLNASYDGQIVDDLISKIKGKIDDEFTSEDFFNGGPEEDNSDFFPEDLGLPPSDSKESSSKYKKVPEIEEFLNWMSGLLYSADHKVTLSTDKDGITRIKLEPIKKGGKK